MTGIFPSNTVGDVRRGAQEVERFGFFVSMLVTTLLCTARVSPRGWGEVRVKEFDVTVDSDFILAAGSPS